MRNNTQYFFALLLILCSINFGKAQSDATQDSLKRVISLDTTANDEKIETAIKLQRTYNGINHDSAYHYGNKALNFAQGKNDTLTIKVYRELGHLAYLNNEYTKCHDYITKGIELSNEKEIDDFLMDLYNVHGSAMQEQGLLNQSMEYFLMSREIAETKKDTFGLVRVMLNLSYIYYRIKDSDKVFENTKEAIAISKVKNYDNVLLYAYNMLGGAHEMIDEYDQSMKYYKKSYHLADSLEMPMQKATALTNIAGEYSRIENYNEAINSYSEAKEIFEIVGDQYGKHEVTGSLGEMYIIKKNYAKALVYSKEAYKFSTENNILYEQEINSKCLYKIYKNTGQPEKALAFHEEYKILSDSVFSTEKKSELTNIELTYQFDKEKEKINIKQKEKELILENNNTRTKYLALIFSMLSLFGLSGFLWIRRKNLLIEKQKKKLEEINSTKDKLFAIIGHDLKRPAMALKGISTKVKYLLDNKDYDRLNRFGNQIEENANSFNAIVNNLLHWALLQKDVMPYNPLLISSKHIINNVLSIYQTEIQSKDIELVESIPQDLKTFSDEVALNAIFSNLIDNAIKFTDEGGKINIQGERSGDQIKISIEDNGKGLSAAQLDKLFSLVKNKTKIGTKGEIGTGLGLHLVYELVKLNKGTIEVESEINKGTKFTLSFPSS